MIENVRLFKQPPSRPGTDLMDAKVGYMTGIYSTCILYMYIYNVRIYHIRNISNLYFVYTSKCTQYTSWSCIIIHTIIRYISTSINYNYVHVCRITMRFKRKIVPVF